MAVPAAHPLGPVQVDPVGRSALAAGGLAGVLALRGTLGVGRHGPSPPFYVEVQQSTTTK